MNYKKTISRAIAVVAIVGLASNVGIGLVTLLYWSNIRGWVLWFVVGTSLFGAVHIIVREVADDNN